MQPITLSHPIAILIRGLPGSGKSYLAHRLQAALGIDQTVLLDPDGIDQTSADYQQHVKQQNAEGVDPKLHLYRYSRAKAYQAIEDHKVIIWNQPFTDLEIFAKMVSRLQEHAAETGNELAVLVVEVELDPATAHSRVVERKAAGGHGPSEATFERFARQYSTARPHGYQVATIQGDADIDTSVSQVVTALNNIIS